MPIHGFEQQLVHFEIFPVVHSCPNGVFCFSIRKDSKWINIKRNIEEFISLKIIEDGFPECLICYEEITSEVGYCNVCRFIYCFECFF